MLAYRYSASGWLKPVSNVSCLQPIDVAKVFVARATMVAAGATFYAAEAYHQDFMARHPSHPYIVVNDRPKVVNLQKLFAERYRSEPVLVGAGG
jgi:peptide-methionine (S)-S-oxide reductase